MNRYGQNTGVHPPLARPAPQPPQQQEYIFGGNTGVSYDQLVQGRKRADAARDALMNARPRTIGEGINTAGSAIAAVIRDRYSQKNEDTWNAQQGQHSTALRALIEQGYNENTAAQFHAASGDQRTTALQQVMLNRYINRGEEAAAQADQRAYEQGIYDRNRGDTVKDTQNAQSHAINMQGNAQDFTAGQNQLSRNHAVDMQGNAQGFTAGQNAQNWRNKNASAQVDAQNKIIKGADGLNYYPDGTRVLPNVEPLRKAPNVQKLTLEDGSELAVQWDANSGKWAPIDAPDGGGDIGPTAKKLSENQSKLTLFKTMQEQFAPVIDDLESKFDPSGEYYHGAGAVGTWGHAAKGKYMQAYDAVKSQWSEGALRIATGAAATPEEKARTENAYFPVYGDREDTITFKSNMRKAYNNALEAALGRGEFIHPMGFNESYIAQFAPEGETNKPDWKKGLAPETRKTLKEVGID